MEKTTKIYEKHRREKNKTHFKAHHKTFFSFVILTLMVVLCVNSVSAWDTSLNNNHVAYYNLDSNYTDITNNSYDLTFHAGSAQYTPGKNNNGSFGDGAYFANTTISLSNNAFSISMWFNWTAVDDTRLIGSGDYFYIRKQDSTGKLHIYTEGGGISDVGWDEAWTVNDGKWHHFVLTHNAGQWQIFVNGTNMTYADTSGALSANTEKLYLMATGAVGASWTGEIDEVGIWNKELTSTEISNLFNNGDGLFYAGALFSVDLTSPTDNQTFYNRDNITFNASSTASLGNELKNATIYINGTIKETNTVSGESNTTSFSLNLSNYLSYVNWTIEFCLNNHSCLFGTNRSIYLQPYKINSTIFNTSTYETLSESFSLNVTSPATAVNLIYNGTSYSATDSGGLWGRTLDIDVDDTGNKSFYWEMIIDGISYNTTLYYQYVNPIIFELCNSTSTSRYLNISFLNEADSTRINATVTSSTWTYYLNDATLNKTYSFSNATQNWEYNFCFMPLDRTINVIPSFSYKQGTDYPQRTWNPGLKSYTNGTANQTLYLLGSTGNSVTFQVLNPSNQQLSGVSVVGTTSIGGVSTIIAQGTTDSAGSINFWLNPEVSHTFNFSRTGFTTQSLTLTPTEDSYSIVMGGSTAEQITDYSRGITLSIKPDTTFELNNDTTYNFNMTLSSSYWSVSDFGFTLSSQNGTQLGFVNSGSGSGTVSLNLDTVNYTRIVMDYYYTINSTNITLTTSWNVFNTGFTQWSISNFFTDLNTYLDTDMFGLDDFGRHLIVYLILFISIGAMSYKYGLTSPIAVVTMVFGIIYMFDVVIGLLPTPIEVIPNFFTFVAGLIMTVVIIRRVIT